MTFSLLPFGEDGCVDQRDGGRETLTFLTDKLASAMVALG